VADPLYGAGQGYLSEALVELGCEVEEIHGYVNPSFGGLNPEPIAENLGELKEHVVAGGFQVGFALDGDADRIGAIDARGDFINSHQIFALLLEHLVNKRGWSGDVIKTVSTTQMIDILAGKYGLDIYETPVGFKYICEHILEKDVLIGGEESGGIGIKNYIPERDGTMISLLLVEIMLANNKTLGELIDDLTSRIGRFCYDRWDVEIDGESKPALLSYLKEFSPERLVGRKVSLINNKDGYKYYLENNGWLMIRPSGTEAVVRLYAEAESPQKVYDLLETGRQILNSVDGNELGRA
jgi:phosphomannomutase